MFQSSAQKNMIRIDDVTHQLQNSESTLKIQLNNWSDHSRVHLYAQQFLPNFADTMRDELESSVKSNIELTNFPFAIWKNMFESNNTIGDEIRYVFDRQKKENKMGNTLDRPTLLMQKQFVQTT